MSTVQGRLRIAVQKSGRLADRSLDLIRDAGFTDVRWQNLTGGIAAVHTGRKA